MGIDEYIKQEGIEIGMERGLKEGLEKGREAERRVLVLNLLSGTEFSDEKIASLTFVPEKFVEEMRNSLANNQLITA